MLQFKRYAKQKMHNLNQFPFTKTFLIYPVSYHRQNHRTVLPARARSVLAQLLSQMLLLRCHASGHRFQLLHPQRHDPMQSRLLQVGRLLEVSLMHSSTCWHVRHWCSTPHHALEWLRGKGVLLIARKRTLLIVTLQRERVACRRTMGEKRTIEPLREDEWRRRRRPFPARRKTPFRKGSKP